MTYDECAAWLVEFNHTLALDPDSRKSFFTLKRPQAIPLEPLRIAWVGPEFINGLDMGKRIAAIGAVYGAEVVHVFPHRYRVVEARIKGALPLDSIIVCSHFAPHITAAAVPACIPQQCIHVCDSADAEKIEEQIRTWAEIRHEEQETRQSEMPPGPQLLLRDFPQCPLFDLAADCISDILRSVVPPGIHLEVIARRDRSEVHATPVLMPFKNERPAIEARLDASTRGIEEDNPVTWFETIG
jgi:hypothetical protein